MNESPAPRRPPSCGLWILFRCLFAVTYLLSSVPNARAADVEHAAGATECYVGAYITSISDVDLRAGTCVVDFWVWFRWRGSDYNPLQSVEVIDGIIDEKTGEVRKTLASGLQYACQRVRATIRQKWNVCRFPLDTQHIRIALEDTESESDRLVFVPDEAASSVASSVSVPGWTLSCFSIASLEQTYETNYGDTDLPTGTSSEYSRALLSLALHRPGMGLFFKLFTGLFVAVGIALVSIAIRPTDLDPRFGLPVGAMFASFASQYVVASVLPATSEFTLADQLHVLAVGVIFLVLLESVASLFLTYADRTWIARRLDAACLVLFLAATIAAVVILVMNARVPANETLAVPIICSPDARCDSFCVQPAACPLESADSPAHFITRGVEYRPREIFARMGAGYAKRQCGTGNHPFVIDLFSKGGKFTRPDGVPDFDEPLGRTSLGVRARFFRTTRLLA